MFDTPLTNRIQRGLDQRRGPIFRNRFIVPVQKFAGQGKTRKFLTYKEQI